MWLYMVHETDISRANFWLGRLGRVFRMHAVWKALDDPCSINLGTCCSVGWIRTVSLALRQWLQIWQGFRYLLWRRMDQDCTNSALPECDWWHAASTRHTGFLALTPDCWKAQTYDVLHYCCLRYNAVPLPCCTRRRKIITQSLAPRTIKEAVTATEDMHSMHHTGWSGVGVGTQNAAVSMVMHFHGNQKSQMYQAYLHMSM